MRQSDERAISHDDFHSISMSLEEMNEVRSNEHDLFSYELQC